MTEAATRDYLLNMYLERRGKTLFDMERQTSKTPPQTHLRHHHRTYQWIRLQTWATPEVHILTSLAR
jgi:hypothetical protein